MKNLTIVGGLIVARGFVDLGMSWAETDVYWDWLGIDVGSAYPYTHWIAFAVGGVLSWIGNSQSEAEE